MTILGEPPIRLVVPVDTRRLQPLLAMLEELVAPGRQPVGLDLELTGQLPSSSPRSSRSAASIFLSADQRGADR